MKLYKSPLKKEEILELQEKYNDYMKITADLGTGLIIVGCELHADGVAVLLENGGREDDIWGGGMDFLTKTISTTAVLNIRPRLNNDSMEILDPKRRDKFIAIVKDFFRLLYS